MTPEKKAPPTLLRECRNALIEAKRFIGNPSFWMEEKTIKAIYRFIDRLTDETLERDEKRRAALENLFRARKNLKKAEVERQKFSDEYDLGSTNKFNEMAASDEKVGEMMDLEEKAFDELDALTPAPDPS